MRKFVYWTINRFDLIDLINEDFVDLYDYVDDYSNYVFYVYDLKLPLRKDLSFYKDLISLDIDSYIYKYKVNDKYYDIWLLEFKV